MSIVGVVLYKSYCVSVMVVCKVDVMELVLSVVVDFLWIISCEISVVVLVGMS